MKKQLRLSTAAIVAAGSVIAMTAPMPAVEAATYKDVSVDANFYKPLQELSAQGIITGYADGTFKPNVKVTRGQVAKILTRMLDLKSSQTMSFSDVSKEHDFYRYASAVVEAGYMDKVNGKFNAKQTLTRNEYAVILMKAFNLQASTVDLPFLDVHKQYSEAIKAVYANGVMNGVNNIHFNGLDEVKRSHLVLTLHRAMKIQQQDVENPNIVGATKQTLILGNIRKTSIITDEGDELYTSTELQKLFRSANSLALRDAEIEAYVKDNRIVHVEKLTIYNDRAASYTLNGNGGEFSFPIIVDGSYFTLSNMTVPVVEAFDWAEDKLTLKNVTVTEQVTVSDGISNEFTLNVTDSRIPKLNIHRDNVTVEGANKINKVFVSDNAYDVILMTAVGELQFASNQSFILRGLGSIDSIHVPLGSELTFKNSGKIKRLQVEDSEATMYLDGDIYIDEAIIPKNADYTSVFAYAGSIQKFISKITFPNSALNLLHAEVNKPSKEEIAYNRALENVIKSHQHALTGTNLLIRTNFNEILKKMEDVPFYHKMYTINHPSNGAPIGISFRSGGENSGVGSISVDALNSGIILEDEMPKEVAKTLGGYFTNGQASYTINFHTKRELIIRTSVVVNGVEKVMEESVINPGNGVLMKNALEAMVDSYTVAAEGNVLSEAIRFSQIDDIIDEVAMTHVLKLHSTLPEEIVELPLVIKKGEDVIFEDVVEVESLKTGISLVALSPQLQEHMKDFVGSSLYKYTYEFDTEQQLDMSVSLMVDGTIFKEGETVTLKKIEEDEEQVSAAQNVTAPLATLAAHPATSTLTKDTQLKWTARYNSTTVQQ